MVEAVMLRYLKKSLGIAMTNILQALQHSFSLKEIGTSFTGASVLCCSLDLFYPKLKEVVLKRVPVKS